MRSPLPHNILIRQYAVDDLIYTIGILPKHSRPNVFVGVDFRNDQARGQNLICDVDGSERQFPHIQRPIYSDISVIDDARHQKALSLEPVLTDALRRICDGAHIDSDKQLSEGNQIRMGFVAVKGGRFSKNPQGLLDEVEKGFLEGINAAIQAGQAKECKKIPSLEKRGRG